MSKRDDILLAAESAFESHGFSAVPIDRVIDAAQVSPRTLYRYFPGKTELAVAVLEARHTRFLEAMADRVSDAPDPLEALFDALQTWLESAPTTGCLFLRALGEYGDAPVAPVVREQKAEQRALLADLVDSLGRPASLVDPLNVLIEGATATAPTVGVKRAVDAARAAARALFS